MIFFPKEVDEQSPTPIHLLHLFLYLFLHLFLPPCLHACHEPTAKKTKECDANAGADDASKKRRALGVLPQKQPRKRPSNATSATRRRTLTKTKVEW